MKRLWIVFLLLFVVDAFAASCPTGFVKYDRSLQYSLATSCASGTTDVGAVSGSCDATDSGCFIDYVCNAGVSTLKTSTGLSVPLYATKLTTPSLNVSVDGGVCYAPLATGKTTGAINVVHGGNQYHSSSLRKCKRTLNVATTPTKVTPGDSSVNWSVVVGDRTLKGISYCGSKGTLSLSALNVTATSVSNTTAGSNLSANIRCWCRVYSPFPSDWIYVNWFESAGASGCNRSCAQACVNAFGQVQTVRANTYNTM